MNAEIAKETIVLGAYGTLLNEFTEDAAAVDSAVGEEDLRRIAEYVDALDDDDTSYNAICEEFLRQQVRESAERLLALVEAEEDAEWEELNDRLSCGCCACCGCSCDEDAEEGADDSEEDAEYDETAAE